jgi:non-ribosomal peptide synthetase component F
MRETEGGLGGVLEYSTDLFEPQTVVRMVENYRLLLEAAVAAPEQSVALLSPDTGAGPGELLAGFSDSIEEL